MTADDFIPRHVTERFMVEPAVMVRSEATKNRIGELSVTETETEITCATHPPSSGDPRVREIMEGGIKLEAMRSFWTVEDLDPVRYGPGGSAGAVIVYEGERWRVSGTKRWYGFSEHLCVRIEDQ